MRWSCGATEKRSNEDICKVAMHVGSMAVPTCIRRGGTKLRMLVPEGGVAKAEARPTSVPLSPAAEYSLQAAEACMVTSQAIFA